MICNVCGNQIDDDSKFCEYCSSSIESTSKVDSGAIINRKLNYVNKTVGVVVIIIGIIACVYLFFASFGIAEAANDMVQLRSQAGNSVAEAYYQSMGGVMNGFSLLAKGLGISILPISLGLGFNIYNP